MADIQKMQKDYNNVFLKMDIESLTVLNHALQTASIALLTIPALPVDSHAALHLERLIKDIDAVRATIEQVGS